MLPFIFHKRLFLFLFMGFILAVVAGILSHECGHWLAGRYFGFKDQTIGYNYTHYGTPDKNWLRRDSILSRLNSEINFGHNAPRDEYDKLIKEKKRDTFRITAGGPIQTMLAGTIGLIFLFLYRRKFAGADKLLFAQWLVIFLSLFWLREIFDVVVAMIRLCAGRPWMAGDEFVMANYLHLPTWSIFIASAIVSLMVLWLVIFRFVPARQRFTFIVAGLTGGLTGAYLWLVLLGPKLMP